MALLTMPFLSPSFAGRSNRTVSTLALTRWAAICAPITPAPSTATLRMRSCDMVGSLVFEAMDAQARGSPPRPAQARRSGAQAGGREADEVLRGLLGMAALGDAGGALDQPEVGHRVGERAGDEVQAPVQLLLAQRRQARGDGARELAQHLAV